MKELKSNLQNSIKELDYEKVSWINKHYVIDLNDKAIVLLASMDALSDEKELEAVENTVTEFIDTIQPVIQQIKDEEL